MPADLARPWIGGDANLITLDSSSMTIDPYGRPAMEGEIEIPLRAGMEEGLVRDVLRGGVPSQLDVCGRSGHSQVGLHPEITLRDDMEVDGQRLRAAGLVASLRNIPPGKEDKLLYRLAQLVRQEPLEIGRLLITNPERSLSGDSIRGAIEDDQLWIPNGVADKIGEDGVVEIPLLQLIYGICEDNMTDREMFQLLRLGKHVLHRVQGVMPPGSFPERLSPGEFFVGGISIALGPYTAVIEQATNEEKVFHLAARILDGIRTTGIQTHRQVELFVNGDESVDLNELKVRVRIYPGDERVQRLAQHLITRETLREGVGFRHVARVEEHPERMIDLMQLISPTTHRDHPHSLILGGNRAGYVNWVDVPGLQSAHLLKRVEQVVSAEGGMFLKDDAIPPAARFLTRRLGLVGGNQNTGKVVVSNAFPDPHTLQALMDADVGVFVAQSINEHPNAFDPEARPLSPGEEGGQLVFESDTVAKAMMEAERKGVEFYAVVPTLVDGDDASVIEAHVRKLERGLWTRPEEIERLEKVGTVVAMYVSHKDELRGNLREQVPGFMRRMKERFGDGLAVTHGKGPGGMKEVDDIAAEEDIFRIGVGITLEKVDQLPNFNPPAMADYPDSERLARQQRMDDISTFRIFNLGGGGTLEEAAITLCSEKLLKDMPTPIIFVDTTGGLCDGENFFTPLIKMIRLMTKKHKIETADGETTIRFLQEYGANLCHLVSSYDEAADIIEQFADDPMAYYQECGIPEKSIRMAWENAGETYARTGFSPPAWLQEKMVAAGICDEDGVVIKPEED